jgi:hypothetical protein
MAVSGELSQSGVPASYRMHTHRMTARTLQMSTGVSREASLLSEGLDEIGPSEEP